MLLHKPITFKISVKSKSSLIVADTSIENNLISTDLGYMLLLPDGNYIVSLASDSINTYVLDGIHYLQTSLEANPSGVSSLTWEKVAGNRLAFENLIIYDPSQTLRFESFSLKESVKIGEIIKSVGNNLDINELENLLSDFKYLNGLTQEISDIQLYQIIFTLFGEDSKVMLSDDFLAKINDGKVSKDISGVIDEIRLWLFNTFQAHGSSVSSYLVSRSEKDKIRIIAAALGIIEGGELSTIPQLDGEEELEEAVNGIVERLGPVGFIMIMINQLQINGDGSWVFKSFEEVPEFLFNKYLGVLKSNILLEIITANEIIIDNKIIRFSNSLITLRPALLRSIEDKRLFGYKYVDAQNFELADSISILLEITFKKLEEFAKAQNLDNYELDRLKNEFRTLLVQDARVGSRIGNLPLKNIIKNLIDHSSQIQARKLGKKFELFSIKMDDGNIIPIVLNEKEIKKYLYGNLYLSLRKRAYSDTTLHYHLARFEYRLAIPHINDFARGVYQNFKESANIEGKLHFIIWHASDNKKPVFYTSPYYTFNFKDDKLENLPFEEWIKNQENFINLHLFYSAFLEGKRIRFSKSFDDFTIYPNSWVGEVKLTGVVEAKKNENMVAHNDRMRIDAFIESFFRDTRAPRTLGVKSGAYNDILSTDPKTFSYLLFKQSELKNALDLCNNYIDYKILNDIAQSELNGEDKKKWIRLYERIQQEGKIKDKDQLELLVNLFITVKHKATGQRVLYRAEITVYDINSEYNIEISPDFQRALYNSKYR